MSGLDYLIGAVGAIILALFGFMMRRNAKLADDSFIKLTKDMIKLEKDLEHFEGRLRQAMSRSEVRELLDDKLEPVHLLLKEIKEDLRAIRGHKD